MITEAELFPQYMVIKSRLSMLISLDGFTQADLMVRNLSFPIDTIRSIMAMSFLFTIRKAQVSREASSYLIKPHQPNSSLLVFLVASNLLRPITAKAPLIVLKTLPITLLPIAP